MACKDLRLDLCTKSPAPALFSISGGYRSSWAGAHSLALPLTEGSRSCCLGKDSPSKSEHAPGRKCQATSSEFLPPLQRAAHILNPSLSSWL